MTERRKRTVMEILLLAGTLGLLTACGVRPGSQAGQPAPSAPPVSQERPGTGFVPAGPNSYDSADTAVVVKRDSEAGAVTLLNLDLGRSYTLSVEGTSRLCDKYGEPMSLEQIMPGDIVDVTFLRSKKKLNTMQVSPSSWVYASATRYEIDLGRGEVLIGEDVYKLTDDTLYLSQGARIEAMELNPVDVLTFRGLGSSIYSVEVEQGHGYLRLKNEEKFLGGYMDIGQISTRRIEEDMLLTVPEGHYEIKVSKRGGGGAKEVTIRRGEETTLDIGDLEVPEIEYGTILFTLEPSDAKLYIDGEKTDPSVPVTLEYGLHQVILRANGYQTMTTYIKVAQPSGGLALTLDAVDADQENDGQEDKERLAQYKVYVDAPAFAEVYLDGNYVGIAPTSFAKSEGSHIITLRRSSCETRSYTISVDGQYKDVTYSFAELLPQTGSADTGTQSSEALLDPTPVPEPAAPVPESPGAQ